MPSFKAAQKNGGVPTITPQYLETARAKGQDGKQKLSDALIAEEISKKDKDFATMWAKRRQGGDAEAVKLLNYYTYGDANYGVKPPMAYQFSQADAMGYFDNPDEIAAQLGAAMGEEDTRVPGAYSIEDQGKDFAENPISASFKAPLKMGFNALAGTVDLAKGLGSAIANPIDAVKGISRGIAGAAELGYEQIAKDTNKAFGTKLPEEIPQFNEDGTTTPVQDTDNQATAKAIWEELVAKRYGSVEAAKKTMFEDPLGVIFDVLSVVDGVGALRGVSKVGKAVEGAEGAATASKLSGQGKIGKVIKAPVKGAKKVTEGAGSMGKEIIGYTTGVGRGAVDETLNTARLGSKEAQAAMAEGVKAGSVREANAIDDVVKELEAARDIRATEYQQGLEGLSSSREILDAGPVGQAVSKSLKDFKIMGRPGEFDFSMSAIPSGSEAAGEIGRYMDELASWGNQAGQNFDTIGLDVLKKRLSEVYPKNPKAKAFVTPIQDALVGVLNKVPGYEAMTGKYKELTEVLTEVKQTLSIGGKTNKDTAIRKLTNLMKNNNENKEAVLRALLKETGNETLMPKLAGVAMSQKTARGAAGVAEAVGTAFNIANLGAFSIAKIAGAFAPMIVGSPRLMHEFLKTVGFTQRQVDKIIEIGRKAGANKFFSDEAVGVGANLGRVKQATDEAAQAEALFADPTSQND